MHAPGHSFDSLVAWERLLVGRKHDEDGREGQQQAAEEEQAGDQIDGAGS